MNHTRRFGLSSACIRSRPSLAAQCSGRSKEESQARVKATYGDNHERLVQVKTKYDPANLFRRNQNIQPQP